MTNSILIGKYISQSLLNDDSLKSYIDNKVYPLVASENTTYPFIVYWRDNINGNMRTKDGYAEDNVSFTVNIVSNNYTNSIEIANLVRKNIESLRINEDDKIRDCHMSSIDESYYENAFIQSLSFDCSFTN